MKGLTPIQVANNDCETDEPLSPMARMFHDSDVYIIAMLGFKIPIDTDVFKANLANTLLKHPRFSSLQVLDEKNKKVIKWKKTEVNLNDHVIVVPVPNGIDIPKSDIFVEDYASNLSKTTISNSIPMWDIHVLNIKTTEAESIAILRVHHSIGDGTSLMSLLLSCTRKVSDPNALPTIPHGKRRKDSDDSDCGWLWKFFVKIWLCLLVYWNTVVDVVMFLATIFFLDDTKTPIKSDGLNSSKERRFVHRTISLDDVKMVKNAMNSTINDVMVGVTQAGLSQYLNRKYGDEKDKEDNGAMETIINLPKKIRFRATLFVNLRPHSGIQAFDEMVKQDSKGKWGNQIGYNLFPLTIALRDDPLDYIRDAKVTSQRKKTTLEAKCTYFLAKFFQKFFSDKMSFPTQTTMWFSNVAGPQEEISYYGHPVAFIAPSCYGQQTALLIHIVSYVNKIKIILSVDKNIIPDPHQLCDDLENAFILIKEAVIAKGLVDNM